MRKLLWISIVAAMVAGAWVFAPRAAEQVSTHLLPILSSLVDGAESPG